MRPAAAIAAAAAIALSAGARGGGGVLALQICLDREGFSCGSADGSPGRKTDAALATWCALNKVEYSADWKAADYLRHFPSHTNLFRTVKVTEEDRKSLTAIPETPAEKAKLDRLGYATILEKLAEEGHASEKLIRKLNPGVKWPDPPAGTEVKIPDARPAKEPEEGEAASIRVSLSRREITVFDAAGKMRCLFPCSIAAARAKRPPAGELEVRALIADPNYTYTPEGKGKSGRHVLPPGPNNPVGTDWIGLTLPTYGIHGTPHPERIGRAESHGCFRLSNWNARRLRLMCEIGTAVFVEE